MTTADTLIPVCEVEAAIAENGHATIVAVGGCQSPYQQVLDRGTDALEIWHAPLEIIEKALYGRRDNPTIIATGMTIDKVIEEAQHWLDSEAALAAEVAE